MEMVDNMIIHCGGTVEWDEENGKVNYAVPLLGEWRISVNRALDHILGTLDALTGEVWSQKLAFQIGDEISDCRGS